MFNPEKGANVDPDDNAQTKPLATADLDKLFASLSKRLIENPKYRLPGNDQPFQTTIVVHGGAVFVKVIKSRDTTFDIDYLAGYTDALLEGERLEESIVLISEEIATVGTQSVRQNVILYEDRGLKVYAMDWCWSFCRKLDRFSEKDEKDIAALLTYIEHSAILSAQKGDTKGSTSELWTWIETWCPLQVANWQMRSFEERVKERITKVANTFKH